MKIFSIACASLLALGATSSAKPPDTGQPDPIMHMWFEALRQPNSARLCCSISDCRFTAFEIKDNQYEVMIDGWPYRVPERAVLRDVENPFGKAVVCATYVAFGPPAAAGVKRAEPQDVMEVLCFVPPETPS